MAGGAAEDTEKTTPEQDRSIPKRVVLTAWSVFLWIFRSPTMLTLIIGGFIGYYVGHGAGAASVLPRAVKAEAELSNLRTEWAEALERQATAQVQIRDDIRRIYGDNLIKMDALDLRLRDLRGDVSLCSAESVLPIAPTTPGTDAEENSGQPRAAVDVLQVLAANIARTCDGNTAQLNALIEWIERTHAADVE